MRKTGFALLLLVLLHAGRVALAAGDLEFQAGRVRSVFTEGREQTILEEGARVEDDEILIIARTISLSGDNNRYIRAEGSVELEDKEEGIRLSAELLRFDSETEELLLEGEAVFSAPEDDILIRSTFLERRPDLAVFQLNVRIVREDMVARAEYVRYFEESGRLELSGFPRVSYKGDEYSADNIIIYTESNEIILEGEVRGQISDPGTDESE